MKSTLLVILGVTVVAMGLLPWGHKPADYWRIVAIAVLGLYVFRYWRLVRELERLKLQHQVANWAHREWVREQAVRPAPNNALPVTGSVRTMA